MLLSSSDFVWKQAINIEFLEKYHELLHKTCDFISDSVIEAHHLIVQELKKQNYEILKEECGEIAKAAVFAKVNIENFEEIEIECFEEIKKALIAEQEDYDLITKFSDILIMLDFDGYHFNLIEKATVEPEEETLSSEFNIIKSSDEERFTLAPWYVPNSIDAHDEWTDAEELQKAVWEYVKSGDRTIYLQHKTNIPAGEWVEIMSWPFSISTNMVNKSAEELTEFPEGTVFICVVWQEWAWDLVKSGAIKGLSIGGKTNKIIADL